MYHYYFFTKVPRIDPTRNFSKAMTLCIVFSCEISRVGALQAMTKLSTKRLWPSVRHLPYIVEPATAIPKRRRSRSSCKASFSTVTLRWSAAGPAGTKTSSAYSSTDFMRVAVPFFARCSVATALEYAGPHALSQAWRAKGETTAVVDKGLLATGRYPLKSCTRAQKLSEAIDERRAVQRKARKMWGGREGEGG